MNYSQEQLRDLDRITNLKLINAITGIKPANLIGTANTEGKANLAIFSSLVHLGSRPPLLGFVARPRTEEVGHTLRNIEATGEYTINHIRQEFITKAHYTSAKFPADSSEFERCGLTAEYLEGCLAPFVKESTVKMGMRLKEVIPIQWNGTYFVIGEITQLTFPEEYWVEEDVNLEASGSVGISGLNTYYSLKKEAWHPYARVEESPDFTNE